MGDVKEVSCSLSVRVNTGNYEGTECFVAMKADVDGLDSPDEVTEDLQRRVAGAMMNQLRAVYAARGKKTSAAMIAKQHGVPVHGG